MTGERPGVRLVLGVGVRVRGMTAGEARVRVRVRDRWNDSREASG